MSTVQIIEGDCLDVLRTMPDESVHCCVSSPPYWGLRDYGVDGQIGLEQTPEEYVAKMVAVFREVRRVLRDDGTCWVNLGSSYAASGGAHKDWHAFKPKDMVPIPWMVAMALQADGWYLRSDIIWHKKNCMPESVNDRPTKAHEYLFLLTKNERYFYDADAIKEPASPATNPRYARAHSGYNPPGQTPHGGCAAPRKRAPNGSGVKNNPSFDAAMAIMPDRVNKRSVWSIASTPYSEAHFATFPPDLIKPCILAGCPVGGTVLDPFGGSGTTGMVALELGRSAILIELNSEYVKLADRRTNVTPGFF